MTHFTHQTTEVKARASGHWQAILPALTGIDPLLLDGKHHPCPRCGGTDRFRLIDEAAGAVLCNQCFHEHNGDGLAALQWLTGKPFRDVLRSVAEYVGMTNGNNGHKSNGKRKHSKAVDLESQFIKIKVPKAKLQQFCDGKKPITIDAIKAAGCQVVRWPKSDQYGRQCVAVPFRDGKNNLVAVQLMRLDGQKFPAFEKLAERKIHSLRGSKNGWLIPGGVERLKSASVIWRVEGPTDLLALYPMLPDDHAIVASSCGAGSTHGLPFGKFGGKRINIIGDTDTPGQAGAEKFAGKFRAVSDDVRLVRLQGEITEDHGRDIRDFLNSGNTFADLQRLADEAEPVPESAATTSSGRSIAEPHGPGDDGDERKVVVVDTEEHLVNREAAAAFLGGNFYTRGGVPVQVVESSTIRDGVERPEKSLRIVEVPKALVRDRLSEAVRFVKESVTESCVVQEDIHPSRWCVDAVHATRHWRPDRPLSGITDIPTLRADGSILTDPGYDPATGLLLAPRCDVPTIPIYPSGADIREAVADLLDVVVDFPFSRPEHQAAWVAAVLTALVRSAFAGPAPLFLIDANVRGSGKSLLCDLASIIATGADMPRMPNPRDEDETRKRILSLALHGDRLILIDNVAGRFGNAALDAALTAVTWKDRILGRSEIIELPLSVVWFASGNNIILNGDTSRRCCHVRLESREEHPEERTGFKHPDIKVHVRDNRGRLVAAALTILRGFVAAGRPDQRLRPWGSFEGWSDLVRSAVVWCGLPDPGETRQELRQEADSEAAALAALIDGWPEVDPDGAGVRVADVLRLVDAGGCHGLRATLLEYFGAAGGKLPSARSLGMRLNHLKRRIIGGRYLDCVRDRKNTSVWLVKSAETQSGDDKALQDGRDVF